ncbi:MAG: hypothetical protein R2911_26700 [Caldilineaceae bacterium]
MDTFDPDGGSSEGPGYWGYGFATRYAGASVTAHRRPDQPVARAAAPDCLPLRTLLSHGIYVNFADCDPDVALEPALPHYLVNRLDLPDLHGSAAAQGQSPHRAYFDQISRAPFGGRPRMRRLSMPAPHDWFSGRSGCWRIIRTLQTGCWRCWAPQ